MCSPHTPHTSIVNDAMSCMGVTFLSCRNVRGLQNVKSCAFTRSGALCHLSPMYMNCSAPDASVHRKMSVCCALIASPAPIGARAHAPSADPARLFLHGTRESKHAVVK